jgi:hypothetical protein
MFGKGLEGEMNAEKQAELKKQIEDKFVSLKQKLLEGADYDERINSVLLVAVTESAVLGAVVEQLRDEVAVLRMCLPRDAVEHATKAFEQAKAEEKAGR